MSSTGAVRDKIAATLALETAVFSSPLGLVSDEEGERIVSWPRLSWPRPSDGGGDGERMCAHRGDHVGVDGGDGNSAVT